MSTREQFGKYLLLKKLTEDPLGETFRAGLLGGKGMERVVLLRIFNGQGLDGGRLWKAVEGRAGIQQALKSPNIGEGVGLGEIEGLPYVAYDYTSGKNMANLLEQAARKRNYVPAEHALLITERIALALASAAETRLDGQRIMHGFLVPHLVMISNEGETRLIGFEVGQALRSFSQNPVIRQHFGRYLAPETLAGAAPDKQDDIYSLGVMLFELLTGRPLPPPGPDGFGSVIDGGVVATEDTPIPDELRALLKQSLVAREGRIKDVVTWHKTLNKFMFEGQYNPTTFNLAFFMHNLFRQEIEKENQEIEVEKTLPVPTVQERREATAVTPPPAPGVAPEGTEPGDRTATGVAPAPPPKKSNAGLIGGLIAALLVLAVVGWYFMSQDGSDQSETTTVAQPAAPPPPAYTGPTEDDLKAQIAELVNQQTGMIQEEYDKKLAELEGQLETARDAQREAEAARQADEERRLAEIAAEEQRQRLEAEAEAEAIKLAEQKAAEEAAAAAAAAEEPEPAEEEKVAEATAPPPPVVAPPPPPTRPQVRRGDLVKATDAGVSKPTAVRPINPRYPAMARRFNKKSATVRLRLLIDENGEVLKVELAGEPQKFGFDTEAIQAAKRSRWNPAKKEGVPVKVWHDVSVQFRN